MMVEPREITVSSVKRHESVPNWEIVSLQLEDKDIIPINFELFEAMTLIGREGLASSVIEYRILMGIDAIRSKINNQ